MPFKNIKPLPAQSKGVKGGQHFLTGNDWMVLAEMDKFNHDYLPGWRNR
jgi:hypothetical protein